MEQDLHKIFLTNYLGSLYERTRFEKTGPKWGIDWVIYNLGLNLYGKPYRLPFLRTSDDRYTKTKSEAEFGVDLAFLSEDCQTFTIFVLKDEALTNRSWTDKDFLRDLELASPPPLDAEGLAEVKHVVVILAYNKDEHSNGVEAYKRFVHNRPSTIGNNVTLRYERWNLSDLVSKTLEHLLSPALVPQPFFGQLSYLCAQAADFPHGSDSWEQQLVPSWKRFLQDVIGKGAGERGISLIPVALIILRQHADRNRSVQTGIIDLIEWAAIALWRIAAESTSDRIKELVTEFWIRFYVQELDRFYNEQMPFLAAGQSIDQVASAGFVGSVAASWIGYWHLGRLGLLAYSTSELMQLEERQHQQDRQYLAKIANWITALVNANVCVYRPVLDIQHIEVFLAVAAWSNAGRIGEATVFLRHLTERLYLRRLGVSKLPFLDGHNSLESVFEQMTVQSPKDNIIATDSSFFVLMLLELCCLQSPAVRDELLAQIHRRLVLGAHGAEDNDNIEENKSHPIDLISWIAPSDWETKVLQGYVEDADVVTVQPFSESLNAPGSEIHSGLEHLVNRMRHASKLEFKTGVPLSALILASLRHRSPLPPELWREAAFPRSPVAPTTPDAFVKDTPRSPSS